MTQNIYDDADFYAGYAQLPRSRRGLAAAPEWPTLRAMLPPLDGKRVLDLGCGFGAFARWARAQGAARVLGLDRSHRMLSEARNRTRGDGITYQLADIAALSLPASSFDLVYSSLVFHYLADFGAMCTTIESMLAPRGRLVFSVEHPLFTAPSRPAWQTGPDGEPVWPTDSYLLEGQRVTEWIKPGVVKYHRTVGTYVNSLIDCGFRLLRLEEWGPTPAQIEEHPEWAAEVHRPAFLLVSAQCSRDETER